MTEKWLSSQEAATILSTNAGRTITGAYVRRLAKIGTIRVRHVDKRTNLYWRADVEKYVVKPRGTGEVRRSLRTKKEQATA